MRWIKRGIKEGVKGGGIDMGEEAAREEKGRMKKTPWGVGGQTQRVSAQDSPRLPKLPSSMTGFLAGWYGMVIAAALPRNSQ